MAMYFIRLLTQWERAALQPLMAALAIAILLFPAQALCGPPGQRPSPEDSQTLVIYHSRGGATKIMAGEIAVWFNARLLPINAEDYKEGISGWWSSNTDAWSRKPARISPEKVDLSHYKLIFLGSPIWWYRPSPPLWTFVEKNEFHGAKVVLFNTFNSRFKQEEIDKFSRLVERQGGVFAGHVWVRRGRELWQISEKELIEQTNRILAEREAEWKE